MAEDTALDSVELEATGQLSDWIELESGKRVRLTFIPSSHWTSILSRQEVLSKGVQAITKRLEDGSSDNVELDSKKLGSYKTSLLEVAGETVALSLRQVDQMEPFSIEGDKLKPEDVEVLALDGLFWEVHNAIVLAHWTNPEQARALFRCWVG
tara:strand:- start:166 stop:624 length:459 start_codon:yes stop_codon:yes gene_type:complete